MHNDKLYIERYAYDLRRLLSTNDGHSTRTRFYMLKDAVIKDMFMRIAQLGQLTRV